MDTLGETTASLRDFLNVIFKRKAQIIIFFLVTFVTVTIGTFLITFTYEATSKILIKLGKEDLYLPTVSTSGPIINQNREEQVNSEIEILTSRYLAEKVVKSLGPTSLYKNIEDSDGIFGSGANASQAPFDKAVEKFRKDLTVEGVKKSNVIEARLKNSDPEMAAGALNTFVNLFLDRHLEVHNTMKSNTFLREQTKILREKSLQSEAGLTAFKKEHNVRSLEEERSILLQKEADLRESLNDTLSRIAETENRVVQLRQQLAATPRNIPQGEETAHSPYVLNTLQGRLVELELKEKELLGKYTEQSRLVKNVRDEIQIVRNKLAEQDVKRYDKTSSGPNPTHRNLQEALFTNQAELKALSAKKNIEQSQFADYGKKLEELNRIEAELADHKEQVELNQKNYHLYLTKYEETRISDAMDAEKIVNVIQIEPAMPPHKPVSPKVLLNLALGLFLGAFGGLGLAFFMEYLDDSIQKPEDAEKAMNLPVLASIPELKK